MKKFGTTSATLVNKYEHKVFITNSAWRAMTLYTETCAKEIGWLGFATRSETEPLHITINDVVLPNQQVHSTTTEIQPEHMMALYDDWCKLYDPITAGQMFDKINVWGHSHVNMSPSPSGQDDSTFKTFIDGGKPFFIRLIMNKSGDVAVDVADMEYNVLTKYADVSIIIPENDVSVALVKEPAKEDIAEYVAQGDSVILTNMGNEIILVDTKKSLVFRGVILDYAQPYTDVLKAQIEAEVKERVKDIVYTTTKATGTVATAYGTPSWYSRGSVIDDYDEMYGYGNYEGKNVLTTPSTGGSEKSPTEEKQESLEESEELDDNDRSDASLTVVENITYLLSASLNSNVIVGKMGKVAITNAGLVHLVAYYAHYYLNLQQETSSTFLVNYLIAKFKGINVSVDTKVLKTAVDLVVMTSEINDNWQDYYLMRTLKVAENDPDLLDLFFFLMEDFDHNIIYETMRANKELFNMDAKYQEFRNTLFKELIF